MNRFTWDPSLETGAAEIDEQHRTLFELANRLHESATDEAARPEAVEDAVYRLTEYVVEHFEAEEALMSRLAYPGMRPHKRLHEALTEETMRLVAAHFNGDPLAASRISPFIAGWLREHIAKEDVRLAEHARSADV